MKNKKIWIGAGIVVLILAFGLGVMIALDYSEWSEYKNEKSVRKLERFVKDSPSNWFVSSAQQKINRLNGTEDSLYNLAITRKTISDCEIYLNAYRGKENRYSNKILQKLDSLSFQDASNKGTREAYQDYLDRFPNGLFFAQALELNQTTINDGDKQRVLQLLYQFHDAYINENVVGLVGLCEPVLLKFESYNNIAKAQLFSMLTKKFENFSFRNWPLPTEDQMKFSQLPTGNFLVKFSADKTYVITRDDGFSSESTEMFSNSELSLEVSKDNYLVTSFQETIISSSPIQ